MRDQKLDLGLGCLSPVEAELIRQALVVSGEKGLADRLMLACEQLRRLTEVTEQIAHGEMRAQQMTELAAAVLAGQPVERAAQIRLELESIPPQGFASYLAPAHENSYEDESEELIGVSRLANGNFLMMPEDADAELETSAEQIAELLAARGAQLDEIEAVTA